MCMHFRTHSHSIEIAGPECIVRTHSQFPVLDLQPTISLHCSCFALPCAGYSCCVNGIIAWHPGVLFQNALQNVLVESDSVVPECITECARGIR